MFSLDVVVWKGKRSEHEAAMKKARQQRSTDGGGQLPRVAQDKKIKQIYGKTTQEMYEAYLHRVDHWMHDAPAQDWTKAYDKETYSRAYVPRERHKDKDLGGPVVKIGSYSPRAVYKGGGKCVRQLVDPNATLDELPRELYRQRIANFEKTREKHKELHPPMMIPKNKPLACGKFFVSDVICCNHDDAASNNQQSGCRKCAARCASPERSRPDERDTEGDNGDDDVSKKQFFQHIHSRVGHGGGKEPRPTAEYVASPVWRAHSPRKWLDRDFAKTVASTTAHTATVTSISGKPHAPSLLIADRFAVANRDVFTPTSPAVRAFEHERRAKNAATALSAQRSPQRAPRKYFNSMWTEPVAGAASSPRSHAERVLAPEPPTSPSTRLGGRDLVMSLREQTRAKSPPPPKSPSQSRTRAS